VVPTFCIIAVEVVLTAAVAVAPQSQLAVTTLELLPQAPSNMGMTTAPVI